MAPKGTPSELVAQLSSAVQKVLSDPAVAEKLRQQGLQPLIMGSEKFGELIAEDTRYWADAVKVTGLAPK